MSNISKAFENKKAFIPFVTCGDPNLETTAKIIVEMANAGASVIELGIPFSDPTAEGPVIESANERALAGGVTTDKIFQMVQTVRPKVFVPLVFMTYANVVFSYGIERFAKKCKEIGVDGIILPDVPFEEKEEFDEVCKEYGIDFISLIAPTSENRIATIAKEASGFLYMVSSLGVTGERSEIVCDVEHMISLAKESSSVPCAVGFGISTPAQAKAISQYADGVIVGSAIVGLCEKHKEESPEYIGKYVAEMVNAIK